MLLYTEFIQLFIIVINFSVKQQQDRAKVEVTEAVPLAIATRSNTRIQRAIAATILRQRESSSNINDINKAANDKKFEMVFVDESDKKRFFHTRENSSAKSKPLAEPVVIGKKKVLIPENVRITSEPSETMELYTQDMNSASAIIQAMKKSK